MTDPTVIEAAARAIYDYDHYPMPWSNAKEERRRDYRDLAATVLAAVTPLIEAKALERAAMVADDKYDGGLGLIRGRIAAAIRALKEQP